MSVIRIPVFSGRVCALEYVEPDASPVVETGEDGVCRVPVVPLGGLPWTVRVGLAPCLVWRFDASMESYAEGETMNTLHDQSGYGADLVDMSLTNATAVFFPTEGD